MKTRELVLNQEGRCYKGKIDGYIIEWQSDKPGRSRILIGKLANLPYYTYVPRFERTVYGNPGCESGVSLLKTWFKKRGINLSVEMLERAA